MKSTKKIYVDYQKVAKLDKEGKENGVSYGLCIYDNQEKDVFVFGMSLEEMLSLTISQVLDEIEIHCSKEYMESIFYNNGFYFNDEWVELFEGQIKEEINLKRYLGILHEIIKSHGYPLFELEKKISPSEYVFKVKTDEYGYSYYKKFVAKENEIEMYTVDGDRKSYEEIKNNFAFETNYSYEEIDRIFKKSK